MVGEIEKEKAVSVTDRTLHRMWDLTLGSVRSIISRGAALAESEVEGPNAGSGLTSASGHKLQGGVAARSDAQACQVVSDLTCSVNENRLWNLSVRDLTPCTPESGQSRSESGPNLSIRAIES